MGDVSTHFNRSEFACNCGCGFDVVDVELVHYLEMLRYHFGQPVSVTSGCRCVKYNKKIKGKKKSQHLLGKAADVQIKHTNPDEVADFFLSLSDERFGIGRYKSFTHFDVRAKKARWGLR